MTTSLPSRDALLDFVAWRDQANEEAWETTDDESVSMPPLTNSFHITDPQHWLDLCA